MATWEAAADGADGGLHGGGDGDAGHGTALATAAEGRIVGQSWSS